MDWQDQIGEQLDKDCPRWVTTHMTGAYALDYLQAKDDATRQRAMANARRALLNGLVASVVNAAVQTGLLAEVK